MDDQKPAQYLDPKGSIEQINADEIKIFSIKHHKIGIILLFTQVLGGLLIGFILIGILLPDFTKTIGIDKSTTGLLAGIIMFILSALTAGFLAIAAYIDRKNELILTNVNITLVNQIGLFNRKVSELTMSSVEDVTVQKSGVLQSILNYGTLVIETAGEQNNFIFKYTYNPDSYAKAIQDSKARYLDRHRTELH